jgi:hypothetical protein
MAQPAAPDKRPVVRGVVSALLVIAVGGAFVVPIYARSLPKLGAFPFFYWYQLVWVPVAAILCWLCYILLRTKPAINGGPGDSGGRPR